MNDPPSKGEDGGPESMMCHLCRSDSFGRLIFISGGGLLVSSASSWIEVSLRCVKLRILDTFPIRLAMSRLFL